MGRSAEQLQEESAAAGADASTNEISRGSGGHEPGSAAHVARLPAGNYLVEHAGIWRRALVTPANMDVPVTIKRGKRRESKLTNLNSTEALKNE